MPMTIEEFEAKDALETAPVLGYGECHRCCFGGPADPKNPWHWPVRNQQAMDRLEKYRKTSKGSSKVNCPICGHGDDTSAFHLDPKNAYHAKLLARREHGDQLQVLQRQLEAQERELRALKGTVTGGTATVVAEAPPRRGQVKEKV